jgi:hypothetical protein
MIIVQIISVYLISSAHHVHALHGKALVALLAACLAISFKVPSFILEDDSLIVILVLQHPNIIQYWRIAPTIS